MGKLLSLLARDNSDCCGPKSSYDIFLDFENAQPSETEAEVYNEVQEVLIKSDKILDEIQVYKVSSDTSLGGNYSSTFASRILSSKARETDAR
jgi:CYRIA/CYRIB Rac1 binding domain